MKTMYTLYQLTYISVTQAPSKKTIRHLLSGEFFGIGAECHLRVIAFFSHRDCISQTRLIFLRGYLSLWEVVLIKNINRAP